MTRTMWVAIVYFCIALAMEAVMDFEFGAASTIIFITVFAIASVIINSIQIKVIKSEVDSRYYKSLEAKKKQKKKTDDQ